MYNEFGLQQYNSNSTALFVIICSVGKNTDLKTWTNDYCKWDWHDNNKQKHIIPSHQGLNSMYIGCGWSYSCIPFFPAISIPNFHFPTYSVGGVNTRTVIVFCPSFVLCNLAPHFFLTSTSDNVSSIWPYRDLPVTVNIIKQVNNYIFRL